MSKKLNISDYRVALGQQGIIEQHLSDDGIPDNNGELIKICISKRRVFNRIASPSDGLLIKIKSNNKGCTFDKYISTNPLGAKDFVIEKNTILEMFSDNSINSLIVFLCGDPSVIPRVVDSIVVEMSTDACNDGGAGGDGLKVKLP